jgi:3'-phosphoadenosine 5'-phosphosulfate sulfotransferase (PAPS reductase)/FAD synthetase
MHQPSDLAQMQSLPLEAKIMMTKQRIKAWYESWTRFEIYDDATGKTRFVTIDTREFGAEPPIKETEWIKSAIDGQVYVSFSGGKDSTVLADLCARVCKQYGWTLYLLFVNTGLEYPEIQKFVKTFAEWLRTTYEIEVVLDIVRPEMRFDEVLKKYGYPVISKSVSHAVKIAKRNPNGNVMQNVFDPENKGRFGFHKWKFLIDSEIPASEECCNVMKKAPAKKYSKETGRKAILGTMACESSLRYSNWLKNGCNAFDTKTPTSQPLSFWTEQDNLHYIKKYDVPYCSVYGDIVIDFNDDAPVEQINVIDYLGEYEPEDKLKTTGCDRTGCIFCMFGCHLEKEPNRFQRLKETHPRQYEYCIGGGEMVDGKWQPSKKGLGLGHVLDYIGVKYD